LASNVLEAWKSFWTYPMELLGDMGHVESLFYLETMLASVQARCKVYARCTIGSEIVLDAPDGTTR